MDSVSQCQNTHLFELHSDADIVYEWITVDEKDAGSASFGHDEGALESLSISTLHLHKGNFGLARNSPGDCLLTATPWAWEEDGVRGGRGERAR